MRLSKSTAKSFANNKLGLLEVSNIRFHIHKYTVIIMSLLSLGESITTRGRQTRHLTTTRPSPESLSNPKKSPGPTLTKISLSEMDTMWLLQTKKYKVTLWLIWAPKLLELMKPIFQQPHLTTLVQLQDQFLSFVKPRRQICLAAMILSAMARRSKSRWINTYTASLFNYPASPWAQPSILLCQLSKKPP